MSTIKHTCEERVIRREDWYEYACRRTASYNEYGGWYCKTHAPSVRIARQEARLAKPRAEAEHARLLALLDGIPDEALTSKQTLYIWLQDHHEVRA